MNKNILVLAGHLDDSVLAVGGIIKKYTRNGYNVSVVCFGNGDEGFADVGERDGVTRKFYAEALRAHAVLGVTDFVCHNYSDFSINENKDIYRLCMEAIRRVKPAVILGHAPAEYFQHRAISRMTEDTWFQSGWACSADLGSPHFARALYQFEVLQPLNKPTHIVDISDTFQDKLDAWGEFLTGQEHLSEEFDKLEARARFRGSQIGVKYAEALSLSTFIPQTVKNIAEL